MSVFKFGGDQSDEPPEFTALLESSMENLRVLTLHHQSTWGIDQADRWDLDQTVGDLVFTYSKGTVKTPAQIIGSFDTKTSTWLWAWANPSIAEHLKRDAFRILEYGKQHRILRLTTAEWKADEMDGWYMAALATTLFNRNGAYRGPADTSRIFITFGQVLGTLLDGELVDFGEPVISTPDFSDVTSEKAALRLGLEGQLFKMLLFPKDFGGADIPQNVVYVPCRVLDIQDEIISMIIPLVQQGPGVEFDCRPEFKGNSFVPAKIHFKASDRKTNWKLDRMIEIW